MTGTTAGFNPLEAARRLKAADIESDQAIAGEIVNSQTKLAMKAYLDALDARGSGPGSSAARPEPCWGTAIAAVQFRRVRGVDPRVPVCG